MEAFRTLRGLGLVTQKGLDGTIQFDKTFFKSFFEYFSNTDPKFLESANRFLSSRYPTEMQRLLQANQVASSNAASIGRIAFAGSTCLFVLSLGNFSKAWRIYSELKCRFLDFNNSKDVGASLGLARMLAEFTSFARRIRQNHGVREDADSSRQYFDTAFFVEWNSFREYMEGSIGIHLQKLVEAHKSESMSQETVIALNALGHSQIRLGKLEEAVSSLSRSLDFDNGLLKVRTHANLASANFKLGQLSDAYGHFQEAKRNQDLVGTQMGELPHCLLGLAGCQWAEFLVQLGRLDEAKATISKNKNWLRRMGDNYHTKQYCDLLEFELSGFAESTEPIHELGNFPEWVEQFSFDNQLRAKVCYVKLSIADKSVNTDRLLELARASRGVAKKSGRIELEFELGIAVAKVFFENGDIANSAKEIRTAFQLVDLGCVGPKLPSFATRRMIWQIPIALELLAKCLIQKIANSGVKSGVKSLSIKNERRARRAASFLRSAMKIWLALADPKQDSGNVNFVCPVEGKQFNYQSKNAFAIFESLKNRDFGSFQKESIVPSTGYVSQIVRKKLIDAEKISLTLENGQADSRQADLIFIHGLGGGSQTTWAKDGLPENFWPDWIASDFPQLAVWTMGYKSSPSDWNKHSLPLSRLGSGAINAMQNAEIGKRPIIFIAHSLGGLVAKEIISQALTQGVDEWKEIANQVRGVSFLATPHAGASLANFAKFLGIVLNASPQVEDLQQHSGNLANLHDGFKATVRDRGIVCQAFAENEPVRPGIKIPFFDKKIPSGISIVVVDATSANLGITGTKTIVLEENHLSICKPKDTSEAVYLSTCRFLRKCIDTISSSS